MGESWMLACLLLQVNSLMMPGFFIVYDNIVSLLYHVKFMRFAMNFADLYFYVLWRTGI